MKNFVKGLVGALCFMGSVDQVHSTSLERGLFLFCLERDFQGRAVTGECVEEANEKLSYGCYACPYLLFSRDGDNLRMVYPDKTMGFYRSTRSSYES